MNTKRILSIVVIVIFAAVLLAACSRSASKAPVAKVTSTKGFPSLTTQTVNPQDAIKTQTAIAKANLNPILGDKTATPTNKPVEAATKEPAVAQPTNTRVPAQVQPTTAPANAVTIPTVTPGLPATYTLQKGEFPYCIARRFNINPANLLAASGLSASTNYFPEGTKLTIPSNPGKFPDGRTLKAHPAKYTVASGDTIYSIACKFGDVEPWAIALANGLSAPYRITTGTVLNIP